MSTPPQNDSWARDRRRGGKQVRLAVFNNEPMVRLAEQRLQQAGIPCMSRCLRGGPGLWGSAYNLPHDLFGYEADESQAREVLELAPRETLASEEQTHPHDSPQNLWLVLAGAVLTVVFLLIMISVFTRPQG